MRPSARRCSPALSPRTNSESSTPFSRAGTRSASWGRHQRRAGPASRGRGHQRGHGGGHRQGIGGHDPAREEPARARGRRAGRPQGLRQHPQVHRHGGEQQLRQHVQRARGEHLRAVTCRWRPSRSSPTICCTTSRRRPFRPTTWTPEQIAKPRPWDMGSIARFILFIGPCSSIFDYTTFLIMLYVFKPGPSRRPRCSRPAGSWRAC